MNLHAWIILLTLLISNLLETIADVLNLKALKPQVPAAMADSYDPNAYEKSQRYTREVTRFGFIGQFLGLASTLLFWFLGGFNAVDVWLRSFGYGEIVTGLLFFGLLSFLNGFISLPLSLYSTFVIEAKYGFNKTTFITFFLDLFKGLLLSGLIGAPILAGILWLLAFAGEWGWLYGWMGVTVFGLLMQYIAPTWIMPLFNKFEPLAADHPLRSAVLAYADKVAFPLQNIFIMDGSKRSTKSNAFFTGFGKNRRIALFDTLIEQHSTDELTAIVAHEVGHYKKKHILKSGVIGFLHTGVLFFLLSRFLQDQGLFDAFYMEHTSVYAGVLFFGMLFQPIDYLLSIGMNILSRKHEFEADAFAAETHQQPVALISALKKLSVHNLSNLTPHPFYVFLNYSHPPLLQRIAALERFQPS